MAFNWKALLGDAAPVIGGILGGPAGGAVGGIIAKALGVGKSENDLATALQKNPQLLEKIKELEINQQTQYLQLQNQLLMGQLEINKTEAQNPKLFIAGWRPFIGWVCGGAFAWQFVLMPIANWVASMLSVKVPNLTLDLSVMMPVLLGLLGLGAMRTGEKIKGVNQQHG